MKDTAPEIEKVFLDKMMKLSGSERVLIANSMFETARKIVLSSFPEDLSEVEKKVMLFLRFYGNDFNEEEKQKIIAWIRKSGAEY